MPFDSPPPEREQFQALIDQVDQLCKQRIERNAEILRLRTALEESEAKLVAAKKNIDMCHADIASLQDKLRAYRKFFRRWEEL